MIFSKRKIILFQSRGFSDETYNELTAHDWDVYVVNNLEQTVVLLNKYLFNVGLCLIDDTHRSLQCFIDKTCLINECIKDSQLLQINQIFSLQTDINWIMGLPPACTADQLPYSHEYKLIAEHCFNYVNLPLEIGHLLITLNHAFSMSEICQSYKKYSNDYPSNFGIIGNSPLMVDLFKLLQKVANEDCSVLIQGETGSGKELIANAIHKHSNRSGNPLITINCGAFPKELIQAEMFGYEKGAFTGAQQRKIGRFESAQGGTLFLDEIGDLPLDQQINLLRFLEDREIIRVGGTEKIPINVRVIAATHVNLEEAVRNGKFREDLYYRLHELQIKTPPLRDRENDIELLVGFYFNKFSENRIYKAKGFQVDSLHLLKSYDWPGNVRQLKNVIHHALVVSENRLLTPKDLGLERRTKDRRLRTLEESRADSDRETILASLRHNSNNMSQAAESLSISRMSLYRLMDKYKIM